MAIDIGALRAFQLCEASIVGMRSNAVFCCRDHKRKFSDSQRDHVAEYKKMQTKEERRHCEVTTPIWKEIVQKCALGKKLIL